MLNLRGKYLRNFVANIKNNRNNPYTILKLE